MSLPAQSLRRALLPLDCSDQSAIRGGGTIGCSSLVAAAVSSSASSGGGGGSVNAIHESLVKVLLRVDCIQPQVQVQFHLASFLVDEGTNAWRFIATVRRRRWGCCNQP